MDEILCELHQHVTCRQTFTFAMEILGGLHEWAELQFDMTKRWEIYTSNAYWSACES